MKKTLLVIVALVSIISSVGCNSRQENEIYTIQKGDEILISNIVLVVN